MKIIAHRGHHNKLISENTIHAFSKALELGADGMETDLRLSLDETIVLHHNDTTIDNQGKKRVLRNLNYNEIKNIRADIPTLKELLKVIDAKAILILEIKHHPKDDQKTYKRLCELVVEQIEDKLDWVEVSCFNDDVLKYMHTLNKNIKLHKLIGKKDNKIFLDTSMEKTYAFTSYFDIDVNLREEVLKQGLLQRHKVIFWTVKNEDLTKEIEAGLYGVMKDEII